MENDLKRHIANSYHEAIELFSFDGENESFRIFIAEKDEFSSLSDFYLVTFIKEEFFDQDFSTLSTEQIESYIVGELSGSNLNLESCSESEYIEKLNELCLLFDVPEKIKSKLSGNIFKILKASCDIGFSGQTNSNFFRIYLCI